MSSENNRGTDACQVKSSESSPEQQQAELLAELLKLAKTVNYLLGIVAGIAGSEVGVAVGMRLMMLAKAIGYGSFLPDSGTYSTEWFEAFLLRKERSIEQHAKAKSIPPYFPTSSKMHRADDYARQSIGEPPKDE